MAKANVILLNSILWNLREISKLAETIKKHCGDVDCTSWRYPLISCSELEIFKLLQNNRNLDSYTYILELTYDRLLYVFNLIVKYMESYDSLERFRPERNVRRPKTLSLASVLCMIWERIRAQMEKTENPIVPPGVNQSGDGGRIEVNISRSTICTQSEVCSISVCSCCDMVQEFVTQLVLQMEKILERQDHESAITAERRNEPFDCIIGTTYVEPFETLKTYIHKEYDNCFFSVLDRREMKKCLVEMTNWSAMSKWLEAIVKDFQVISKRSEQEALSSRRLRNRIDADEQKTKLKMEQYEEEIRILGNRLREGESKISSMREEMEKVTREKNHLKEVVSSKNARLSEVTLNFENQIKELRKSYEGKLSRKREKKARREMEREEEWKRNMDLERRRREEAEGEISRLNQEIAKVREEMENSALIEEKAALKFSFEESEKEVQTLKEQISNLNSVISQKQITIDDYSRRLMEAFPQLNGTSKTAYKASGNPQIDMENQIEANNLRMELMKTENEKLSKALNKMKALKG